MRTIIAIDNSCQNILSMALFKDRACITHFDIQTSFQNSSTAQTVSRFEDLLKQSDCSLNTIDAYIVNRGPGSFTGLRSSMAFVQGLSLSSGAPLYGVTSFEALHSSLEKNKVPLSKSGFLLDTKCHSFYAGHIIDGKWSHAIINDEDVNAFIKNKNIEKIISDRNQPETIMPEACEWHILRPNARLLAEFWLQHSNQEDLINLDILYLKSPV